MEASILSYLCENSDYKAEDLCQIWISQITEPQKKFPELIRQYGGRIFTNDEINKYKIELLLAFENLEKKGLIKKNKDGTYHSRL